MLAIKRTLKVTCVLLMLPLSANADRFNDTMPADQKISEVSVFVPDCESIAGESTDVMQSSPVALASCVALGALVESELVASGIAYELASLGFGDYEDDFTPDRVWFGKRSGIRMELNASALAEVAKYETALVFFPPVEVDGDEYRTVGPNEYRVYRRHAVGYSATVYDLQSGQILGRLAGASDRSSEIAGEALGDYVRKVIRTLDSRCDPRGLNWRNPCGKRFTFE